MRNATALCLVAVAVSHGSPSLAWNKAGHMVIGLIAHDVMDENSRSKAIDRLKKHPRFEDHFYGSIPEELKHAAEETQDRWAFAWSTQWPDQVKQKRGLVTRDDVERYNRRRWHYINIPAFLDAEQRDLLEEDVATDNASRLSYEIPSGDSGSSRERRSMNVVQALKFATMVTSDEDVREHKKGIYICWIGHLLGDLHQPLHSTALFTAQRFEEGDKGGNQIKSSSSNLHSLWDGRIHRSTKYNSIRSKVEELLADEVLVANAEDAAEEMGFSAWVDESHELAPIRR